MPISMKAHWLRKRTASSIDLGERSDQMRAIEFAGQRVVARQFDKLLVAGVALVVDPHNALDAHRSAVGAGKPAAGLLDPLHGCGRIGPHPVFDAVGRALAALGGGRRDPSASERTERCGSIRFENSAPLARRSRGISGKTAATCSLQTRLSVAISQTKAAWPSEARMAEAGGRTGFKIASFRDRLTTNTGGPTLTFGSQIWASCAPTLCKVHKYSGNHVRFSIRNKRDCTRHDPCEGDCSRGRNVPKCNSSAGKLSPRCPPIEQSPNRMRARLGRKAEPVAARWCRWRSPNGGRGRRWYRWAPDPIFITHLIAEAQQVPQARRVRRASLADAQAAYRPRQTPAQEAAGSRMRQVV